MAKVYDSKEPAIFRGSDNRNIGIFTKGKIFVYDRIETVADKTQIYFDHENNGSAVECYSFYDGNFMTYPSADKSNASLLMEKYNTVLDSLAQGKTTYFTELPDPVIEVSASTSLGNTGVFGGYDGKNQGMIHLEVFSDDVVIPDYEGKNYELIELEESPSALCNREEMTSYYNQKPAKLRNMICRHKSEWSDKIEWEEELSNSIGVPKGHPVIKDHLGEKIREDIKGYVNSIYEPFKWFNSEDCLMAMNPSSDSFLSQGCATFYHPIEFMEWLTIHDGLLISLASN
ncbi:MAG: hypothetical protein JXA95_13625 [Spirochaetales bacterium]|nr:hypothetical protein [Spirochaetales bacterium]